MKLSISLPDEDVAYLDEFAAAGEGIVSRSAVVHRAVRLLRASTLGAAYEEAWTDWVDDGDEAAWASASPDGIDR